MFTNARTATVRPATIDRQYERIGRPLNDAPDRANGRILLDPVFGPVSSYMERITEIISPNADEDSDDVDDDDEDDPDEDDVDEDDDNDNDMDDDGTDDVDEDGDDDPDADEDEDVDEDDDEDEDEDD